LSIISTKKVSPLDNNILESLNLAWHTDEDGTNYISDELVIVKDSEAEALYKAANEIYDMFIEAGEYVLENNLLDSLSIPFNLHEIVKNSWESDVHWHLYGRFDFAGGVDGLPIKLIEFNADTPTSLYESAIIQWAILKHNNLEEKKQFNNIYEALKDNFKRLITMNNDIDKFEEYYDGWKILFSSYEGIAEEEITVKFLEQIAKDAGFQTDFEYLENVGFSDENGICNKNDENFEYWFKLFPWEDIAIQEGDLSHILTNIITDKSAIILNPAYTLMFQSKAMLKILYDLFPDSPYLLECSFKPLPNKKQVQKRVFGREGANITIFDSSNNIVKSTDGEYDHYKSIYQEYASYPKDKDGNIYQAGVFFAYEACGLGFRKGDEILDNSSKFVGHIVE
jgi:glutathionylspermidine synthase